MALERELEAARAIAREAGELALRYQRAGVVPETKLDLSPVTEADRESERLIARRLEEVFPEDGLLGEEGALKKSSSGRRWIIDPVDGTKDFVRGIPTWAVLLALEEGDQVQLGVCNLAAQENLYWAGRGTGAWRNDTQIHISGITEPGQALLCINDFNKARKQHFGERLAEWMGRFWAVRSMGGCQDAMLVAGGQAEAWIEPTGKAWDFAALKVIAEEAGAVFFNYDGGSSIYAGNCLVTVPALEAELRRFVLGGGADSSAAG